MILSWLTVLSFSIEDVGGGFSVHDGTEVLIGPDEAHWDVRRSAGDFQTACRALQGEPPLDASRRSQKREMLIRSTAPLAFDADASTDAETRRRTAFVCAILPLCDGSSGLFVDLGLHVEAPTLPAISFQCDSQGPRSSPIEVLVRFDD